MEVTPVPSDPVALASVAQFQRRFPDLCKEVDPIIIGEALVEATSDMEERVSRRLAPFASNVYNVRLKGIDPDEYGDDAGNMPLDISGSLNVSFANALGAGSLVRHFWLPEYAPFYPELWTYTIESMTLLTTYGTTQAIDLGGNAVFGPDITDGHCCAPGTRILTSDLRWVPVEDLQVGDGLVGFDEASGSKERQRKHCYSVVEATEPLILPCSRIEFEDGTEIVCSDDHRWLVRDPATGAGVKWLRTDEFRTEEQTTQYLPTMVSKPFDTWEPDTSYEAGYLAGALDGEGYLSVNNATRDRSQVLGVTQRENELLDAIRITIKERDFDFRDWLSNKPQPETFTRSEDIHYLTLRGGRPELTRLLGTIRPPRLLSKFDVDRLGNFHRDPLVAVRRVVSVGLQEVIALQTSSRTYLAEGFASHNCWLRLGTFAPIGTRITVLYSGGYTIGTPPALQRACLYQAAKFLILDYEPQQRRSMSLEDIDTQIDKILVPWSRG